MKLVSKAVFLLWIFFSLFVAAFAILPCLFLADLWSPIGKGLTSSLSCMRCFHVFYHFPIRCPGSPDLSIADICLFPNLALSLHR